MSSSIAYHALLISAILTATPADEKIDPAKLKEKVSITLGKKLEIQFEQSGDALTHPKIVEEASDKTPTVSIEFLKQGDNLILATKNPYPKNMKFRAAMRLKGRTDFRETTIVPVVAKLFSFEAWQDPIEELVLFEYKLVEKD